MIEEIKNVIISSRNKIAYEVNNTMLLAYWNVGRIIAVSYTHLDVYKRQTWRNY